MKNEEVKESKSKGAKILGVIGIVALIAYNGWVVFNNHLGGGGVQGTVKELLVENIPNCINDEIVKFVELDDVKLDGIADDKWDGVAMAKLKAKESGKVESGKFTFDVEKKGAIVSINNLMLDEKSVESLLSCEKMDTGSKAVMECSIKEQTSKSGDVKTEKQAEGNKLLSFCGVKFGVGHPGFGRTVGDHYEERIEIENPFLLYSRNITMWKTLTTKCVYKVVLSSDADLIKEKFGMEIKGPVEKLVQDTVEILRQKYGIEPVVRNGVGENLAVTVFVFDNAEIRIEHGTDRHWVELIAEEFATSKRAKEEFDTTQTAESAASVL